VPRDRFAPRERMAPQEGVGQRAGNNPQASFAHTFLAPDSSFAVQRLHIPPVFLGTGITNMPVGVLSPVDQAQMSRLFDDLTVLTAAPAHPFVRQYVVNSLMGSIQIGPRPHPQSVGRFVNNLALVTPGLGLPHLHQVLLTRNIHLLIAHGAALTDLEAHALLWHTQSLLQIGGLFPQDVQLLTSDLAAILAETRQVPWARG
jgi:hypothetical protein